MVYLQIKTELFIMISITYYKYFAETGYIGRISVISYKNGNFCDFLFAFLYTKAILKGGLL